MHKSHGMKTRLDAAKTPPPPPQHHHQTPPASSSSTESDWGETTSGSSSGGSASSSSRSSIDSLEKNPKQEEQRHQVSIVSKPKTKKMTKKKFASCKNRASPPSIIVVSFAGGGRVVRDDEDDEDNEVMDVDEEEEEGEEGDDEEDEENEDEDDDEDDDGMQTYDRREQAYYDATEPEIRGKIDEREAELLAVRRGQLDVPMRFRVLLSSIPAQNALAVFERMRGASDRDKAVQFGNYLARIPFGKYSRLPIGPASSREDARAFLDGVKRSMDSHVYGMDDVKSMFMITIAKWARNPAGKGIVIGLKGPMGVGKTTLVKDGVGRALGIPSAFIALGSANDVSFLEGHSYTWEGSIPGQIAESIMSAGVMNPILCFDELDKVDDNSKGNEIINSLIHITDKTQNESFCDKYFGGNLPFDLSRCIIVFTYNDANKINPILHNRLVEIAVRDYSAGEKMEILKKFIVPKELAEFGSDFDVRFSDDALRRVMAREPSSTGLRDVQHDVAKILGVVNLDSMMKMRDDDGDGEEISLERIEAILKKFKDDQPHNGMSDSVRHMYA